MRIFKILKRGQPKELAPIVDFNPTCRVKGGEMLGADFGFAKREEDEEHGFTRIKGDAYALRFESLQDVLLMRMALTIVAKNWSETEGKNGVDEQA